MQHMKASPNLIEILSAIDRPDPLGTRQPDQEQSNDVASRESRVRRLLKKRGHYLAKTPARSWLRKEYGAGYMVTNDRNTVVLGAHRHAYDGSLEEVEGFAADLAAG